MPFREKSAWISLVCLLLTFGLYFLALTHGFFESGRIAMQYFVFCVIAFAVLQIALHVIAASLSPKEANTPRDEREQTIALKSVRIAYFVLGAGLLCVPLSMHAGFHEPAMGYLAMAVLVLAEISRQGSIIVYFRRDR